MNNLRTSYSTLPKMLPNDNVSMSVGHLDHVLIVYSMLQHVLHQAVKQSRRDQDVQRTSKHRH